MIPNYIYVYSADPNVLLHIFLTIPQLYMLLGFAPFGTTNPTPSTTFQTNPSTTTAPSLFPSQPASSGIKRVLIRTADNYN